MAVMAVFIVSAVVAQAQTGDLERARALYQQTKYPEALRIVETIQPQAPVSFALAGLCHYMMGDYKKAAEVFEKAVAGDEGNSVYWDWLGRAYGKRAETSNFLTAPVYARRARQHFEKAVELDPANIEAADDLFEYYLQAPGLLGGGEDKAAALTEKVREKAPAKYHSMRARLEEKRKDLGAAAEHWRQAAEAAPNEPGRYVDLARFLARQGRHSESDAAFDSAAKIAPDRAQTKFQRARTYVETGRNLELARKLLQEYLNSPLTPDDPSPAEAEQLLQEIPGG
jgi:tetratricopeptide (TPR) repeat protein